MICKQCGNKININDEVCAVCGARVDIQTMLVDDDIPSEQNPYSVNQPTQPQPDQQLVQPQPVQPQYAQPQPVQPQYVQPQPVQPQHVQPQPVQPQYAQPHPVQPQYVQPQPVQPKPMRPQYESSQPIQPQSIQPQYTQPQPIQPQYVQPQPVQPQYVPQPVQQAVTPESNALSGSILGFGIAAICCAWFPIASILGIIFGAIAKGRAKTFDAMGYPTNGKRVTGKVLGIIGFVAGIIMTVYWVYYFILMGVIFANI